MFSRLLLFICVLSLSLFLSVGVGIAKVEGIRVTREMIYEKLIEIEKRQAVFEERFKQIDKRFEQIDKRFEDMNKRFEDMNKRFAELREDMNRRFEEQLRIFKWIAGVFTAMVIGFISLLIWDRRSAMRAAVKEAEEELDRRYRIRDLPKFIEVLREKAKRDSELAEILRSFHLF